MNCMIAECSESFSSALEYFVHLEEVHRIPKYDFRYECTFQNCPQIFNQWQRFKKHVVNHKFLAQQPSDHNQNNDLNEQSECQNSKRRRLDTHLIENAGLSNQQEDSATNNTIQSTHKDELTFSFEDPEQTEIASVNFTLSMHMRHNITRKDVYFIQSEVNKITSKLACAIEDLTLDVTDAEVSFKLKKHLCTMKNLFKSFNTDHKLFKYLENLNCFALPSIITTTQDQIVSMPIDASIDFEFEPKQNFLLLMPLEFQIKAFFNSPNILQATLDNTSKLKQSLDIKNFVNGSLWRSIENKYQNDIILPVWLYSDEFEINDSLSSHSSRHSVCGIYYNFPTIPEHYKAKLSNILVAGMLKKQDIKNVGINRLINEMISKFKEIETKGILFDVNGQTIKIRFVLSLLQGDNLGIHTMLMLAGGFNARFYCRFCKRPKELLKNDTHEFSDYMRNKTNYNEDLLIANQSETGISGNSVFNDLPSFHVVENKSVDPMHDLFSQGICKFGLTEVLNYCIFKKGYINLKQLNLQRQIIAKTCIDEELKRMPDIGEIYLPKQKHKSVTFKMTSSEMRCFVHYFTLLIGEFVPYEDMVWKYCLCLINLIDLCLKRSFSNSDITRLKNEIDAHHRMFVELFEKDLKPKHHVITHYPTIIETSGPVANMMCFRNEAKHRGFKQYAHVTSSRKNICYTLCIKASLQFCYDLLNQNFFTKEIVGDFESCDMKCRHYFDKIVQPIQTNIKFENVNCSSSVEFKGTLYKRGSFLVKLENSIMNLYEIVEMVLNGEELYVVCDFWEVGIYNNHFLAYEAKRSTSQLFIFEINFFDGPPLKLNFISGRFMFRVKNSFNNCY
ncbi:uncharacterized protein LOC129749161 [Uranotaenia lowii]|uniref:uncharacterized protein LOC129749161 n=1 Tax=Uranotaenia lowii TaxID=190385 RepID=UPI00247A2B24|nr:uncharacterized protein LOC129749161 [Uranotaenia lowii]